MNTERTLHELFQRHAEERIAERMDRQSWLQDLGLDSIAMMGLLVDIEDTFSVVLDQTTLLSLRTVGDLVAWLEAPPRSAAS